MEPPYVVVPDADPDSDAAADADPRQAGQEGAVGAPRERVGGGGAGARRGRRVLCGVHGALEGRGGGVRAALLLRHQPDRCVVAGSNRIQDKVFTISVSFHLIEQGKPLSPYSRGERELGGSGSQLSPLSLDVSIPR